MENLRFDGVLFDLDGTLVDTAPDMVRALNELRRQAGLSDLAVADMRHLASFGTGAMLLAAFPGLPAPDRKPLARGFLDGYLARICEQSVLFPGMAAVLEQLDGTNRPWGVVTNKPRRLTEPLLKGLRLAPACVVSGDSLAQNKPDPAPVRHACAECGLAPERTLFVGDAERDVEAGRAAGVHTAAAGWGYLGPDDAPARWGATFDLESPEALARLLAQPATRPAAG